MRTFNMMESKALLFIHAAYEDNNFDKAEREFIEKKFSSAIIDSILEEYQKLDPGKRIEIITDLLYDMVWKKDAFNIIRQELMELFQVDGDVSQFEVDFIHYLDKIQRYLMIKAC